LAVDTKSFKKEEEDKQRSVSENNFLVDMSVQYLKLAREGE
jgi:hypothetical protein